MNRQSINQNYYQKNKEQLKARRKLAYQQQKQPAKSTADYYQSHNIQVLLSLKEYTQLSPAKHKLWHNLIWTLQDLQQTGCHDIIQILKVREEADNLIRDYWTVAKGEKRQGSKSWNNLDPEQQQRLIKYWAKEKIRRDHHLLTQLEQLEQSSHHYLKTIELAKYHEERGKLNCTCYDCQTRKEFQQEIKTQLFKPEKTEKKQCPDCQQWVKSLVEDSGVCWKCEQQYG